MKCKNHVELIGTVGFARYMKAAGRRCCRFSLATNFAYRDRDNCPVINTTWSQVVYWEDGEKPFPEEITKGTKLHVTGRLGFQRYTDESGMSRETYEIIAKELEVIDSDECLEMEM